MPNDDEIFPLGTPHDFPLCGNCPYLDQGTALACATCVRPVLFEIAARSCETCGQMLDPVDPFADCPNWLCANSTRSITRIHPIAYSRGRWRKAILDYKYENRGRYANVFGRVLIDWLETNMLFDPPAVILANPTYTGSGAAHAFGHTEAVLQAAARHDPEGRWGIDDGVPAILVKPKLTPRSVNESAYEKRSAARRHASVIEITAPSMILGKRVVIFDDICTTGYQLDEVAKVLLANGADSVEAVVLARHPWRYGQNAGHE